MKTVLQERMASFDNLFNQHTAWFRQLKTWEDEGNTTNPKYLKKKEDVDSIRRKILALSPTAQKIYGLEIFDDIKIYNIANKIRDSLLNDEAEGLLKSSIDSVTDFDDMFEETQEDVIESLTYNEQKLVDEDGIEQIQQIPVIKLKKKSYVSFKQDGKMESTVARFKRGVAAIANTIKSEELAPNEPAEIDLDPAVVEQAIVKLLQSDNGTNLVLSIVSKNHYTNISKNYLSDFYNKNVKEENGKAIPLTDVGQQMLLAVNALDENQNKIVSKSLWAAICDYAFDDLSKKYIENASYYNNNSNGNNSAINEKFIQTLTECMNLASAKLVLKNQSFAKDILYLSLPANPYTPVQEQYNPGNIFQDPLKVSSMLQGGVNPQSIFDNQQQPSRVLTQQEQIQLAYNIQNQVHNNPSLINREPNPTYTPPNPQSSYQQDFAKLESNVNPVPQLIQDTKITF
jgi:hypothetical protein